MCIRDSGLTANLGNAGVNSGDATGDSYSSIENLIGSGFNDNLAGDANANTIDGGAGNDTLDGGAGADSLIGGAGTDAVSYASSGGGLTVSLGNTALNTGDAAGDTYNGIENLTGSSYNDVLYGDGNANSIDGGIGNDTLMGDAGADTLTGGAGTDTVDYSASAAGVTAYLTGTAGSGLSLIHI